MLSVSEPDNCCVIQIDIIHIKIIMVDCNNEIIIAGQKFHKKSDFYSKPRSSDIGVYEVEDLDQLLVFNINQLSHKCIKFDL